MDTNTIERIEKATVQGLLKAVKAGDADLIHALHIILAFVHNTTSDVRKEIDKVHNDVVNEVRKLEDKPTPLAAPPKHTTTDGGPGQLASHR
jgi:hypothetical protein